MTINNFLPMSAQPDGPRFMHYFSPAFATLAPVYQESAQDVMDWCDAELSARPIACSTHNNYGLSFASDDDAMLFKLRWL